MKLGVNQWAFPENMAAEECIEIAGKAGFDGIELNLTEKGPFSLETTDEGFKKIVRKAESCGIKLPSVCSELVSFLTSNDPAERQRAIDGAIKTLDVAQKIGAQTILLVPGGVDFSIWIGPHDIVSYDVAYQRALEGLKTLGPEAEKRGIRIGVENVWNKFLLSPLEFKHFIDEIHHDYIKVYFDVGNVVDFGYPEQWIRILRNRIIQVHIKDFRRSVGTINGFVNLLEGDVDWKEVVKALTEIGYQDFIMAEVMPPFKYHPERLIYETANSMKAIFHG